MRFEKQFVVLFKKAKADCETAKIIFAEIEKGNAKLEIWIVFFHLQQSVEKALKALLAYHKVHILKTHDIGSLLMKLEEIGVNAVFAHFLPLLQQLCPVNKPLAIIPKHYELASSVWCVPVSNHANPLPISSSFNFCRCKYASITEVISSSPLGDGCTFLATSLTPFGKKYSPTIA